VPEPVLVQQGLVPEQLEQALEALLELLEQALEALLGLVPLLAFLREQVVPVQGGLRVVVVLAACLFYLLSLFSPTPNLLQ
tara:strand:+ start:1167 stop:1409 length:243 start_codon:yes stop_codon:yes gene_type:complete